MAYSKEVETISMSKVFDTNEDAISYIQKLVEDLSGKGYTISVLRVQEYWCYDNPDDVDGKMVGYQASITGKKSLEKTE